MTQLIVPTPTSVDTLDGNADLDPFDAGRVPPGATRHAMADRTDVLAARGVPAVLVVRNDGMCVLYHGGQFAEWPSIELAWSALRRQAPRVVWRETTAGVWIGRPDRNDRPTVDRGSRPTRRAEASAVQKPSPTGDSYMTARIVRGLSLAS